MLPKVAESWHFVSKPNVDQLKNQLKTWRLPLYTNMIQFFSFFADPTLIYWYILFCYLLLFLFNETSHQFYHTENRLILVTGIIALLYVTYVSQRLKLSNKHKAELWLVSNEQMSPTPASPERSDTSPELLRSAPERSGTTPELLRSAPELTDINAPTLQTFSFLV